MPARAARRLVVLRALGLGDLLTAVPALRALAAAHPRHERLLAAPAALRPLLGMLGDAGFALEPVDYRAGFAALPGRVRDADVAVNLHGPGPQSHHTLVGSAARRLLAFRHPDVPESADGPDWDDDEHEVARWCRMLRAHGLAADPGRLQLDVPDRGRWRRLRGATVVHPGAASAARRWPAERWAAVARAERADGRAVVVTGGPDERALARRVAELAGLPDAAVVAGRTDLAELAELVAAAGRVVCGDTGVAHLASATATPSVVLFGPVSPRRWGPPAAGPHVALWAGGSGDPHADRPDRGLLRIGVDEVLAALARLPGRAPADRRAARAGPAAGASLRAGPELIRPAGTEQESRTWHSRPSSG